MDNNERVKESLKKFMQTKQSVIFATCTDFDEAAATCTADIGNGLLIEDVRLRAIEDASINGFYIIPAVNSKITLLRLGQSDDFQVVGFSEYEKVIVKHDAINLQITQNNIIFNDNVKNSFICDINEVVTKLNTIESDLNTLKTAFTTWVPVPTDGGALLKTLATAWAAASLTPTVKADIKDENILN